MMKADVLSGFKFVKICIGYNYKGKLIDHLPYNLDEKLEPEYIEMKGWKEDISNINTINDFPKEFQAYINFLEKELQKPISIISVGPDRSQTIFR